MNRIHFLNVLEGDCNIIQHDSGRVTVIDVSNAYNGYDTEKELAVRDSQLRRDMYERTQVPTYRRDFKQKKEPDNPILYLKEYGISDIFRFIVTHPDMDHLDGIKDFFDEFNIGNLWDTNNTKEISNKAASGGYNLDDWRFYKGLRDETYTPCKRLTYYSGESNLYYNEDNIHILSPTVDIVSDCNASESWNAMSYVTLFTPPKINGGHWKILFAGDSEDSTWDSILSKHSEKVKDVDVLFAPHHGRDSGMSFDFLKTVNPKVTLFGNASSKHLAYSKYENTVRITNNQAGYIILEIENDIINIYVKNKEFADYFRSERGWSKTTYNSELNAYLIAGINP